jgi:hypothetical protein
MIFIAKKTNELTNDEWGQIGVLFEVSFHKKMSKEYFIHKYKSPFFGFSYHGFMLNDEKQIVGAMTIIPFEYKFFSCDVVFGIFVDLMINPNYRNDIMNFKRIYDILLLLVGKEVDFFYAVPNQNSSAYFLKILQWKKIGKLNYYIWPINLSKIVNVPRFLDLIINFANLIIHNISIYFYPKSIKQSISKKANLEFHQYRFSNFYKEINCEGKWAKYRIYDEKGVITAYLVDFFPLEKKWLSKIFKLIYLKEKLDIDVILYVSNSKLGAYNVFKTPEKWEPRKLSLIGKINHSNKVDSKVFDIKNWSFNLSDFDVR